MAAEFEQIWTKQYAAAREIRANYGVVDALAYLVGETVLPFAETAVTQETFRAELPIFVAKVRKIFECHELANYYEGLATIASELDAEHGDLSEEELLWLETEQERAAKVARSDWIKELLTVDRVGIG